MRLLAFALIVSGAIIGVAMGFAAVWLTLAVAPVGQLTPSDPNENIEYTWIALTSIAAAILAIPAAVVWLAGGFQRVIPRVLVVLAIWHLLAAFLTFGIPGCALIIGGAWVASRHQRVGASKAAHPVGRD
ncbi:MAG: hypothetical protein AB7I38_03970 [Dehalococcoidia bacterium]